jgi:HK97 family phage major capsid protein
MTLAEKIVAARAALVATKDQLTALSTSDQIEDATLTQIEELTRSSEAQTKSLETLVAAEKALALGAAAAGAQSGASNAPSVATKGNIQRKGTMDLIVRSALAAFESYQTHETVDNVIARRYPGNLEVNETSKLMAYGLVHKAAVNPAMTNVAGWAQELVREGFAAFMEALTAEAVVPRIPMARYSFDGYAKITLPKRNVQGSEPNLSAAFRAEGAPIRVGRTTLESSYLTPKSMAVIGTFTKELLQRSTPNIEDAIRRWMLEDTAYVLDGTFFDNIAGTAIRPAGLQYGIDPADTAASTGNTAADIINDIRGRLTQMSDHKLGRRLVWVMNPASMWGLTFSKTATGDSQFPETANGQLAGIPVITSTNIPRDLVFLLDAAEIGFAGGAPSFEGTDVATIHEEDGAPNANMVTGPSVLPISTGAAGAGVVATPARSLFQTHSAAIKAFWELDWTVTRPGAVQVITGVAW